jgi:hypothetical protein
MPTDKKSARIPHDQQAKPCTAMAKFALVEPTYDQLTEACDQPDGPAVNAITTITSEGEPRRSLDFASSTASNLAAMRRRTKRPVAPGGDLRPLLGKLPDEAIADYICRLRDKQRLRPPKKTITPT